MELFLEERLFSQKLRLSESLTYIDARILKNINYYYDIDMAGKLIPYVSNYKATLGINYDISRNFGVWMNNSFVGAQKDAGYNDIDAYILTDLGVDCRFGDFSLSVGVRNLFDSAYFAYINSSNVDRTSGYSYLYAPGRSFFADLRYAF